MQREPRAIVAQIGRFLGANLHADEALLAAMATNASAATPVFAAPVKATLSDFYTPHNLQMKTMLEELKVPGTGWTSAKWLKGQVS